MAELGALNVIKNAFLAPLAKTHPTIGEPSADRESPSLPPPVTSRVARHDHHNVEVTILSQLGTGGHRPSVVETDLYLFVPRSFEIRTAGKAELLRDFRSRIRLALPINRDQSEEALTSALRHLMSCLERLERLHEHRELTADLLHSDCEELFEATKVVCTIVAETIKHSAVEHGRSFFLSHTLMTTANACFAGLRELEESARAIQAMVLRVRQVTRTGVPAAKALFSSFDEYVSQLYIQYLSSIRSEISRIGIPTADVEVAAYARARGHLELAFDEMQEAEAAHRLRHLHVSPEDETEIALERRLVRLSHLKKFFQSKNFVDVSREPSAKRVSESTATIGTAMAGLAAAIVEKFSHTGAVNAAFQGITVLAFGVIIYVFRDRLKDWAKQRFQEKALQFLPDFEQKLVAREKPIGTVKEWFGLRTVAELPAEIRAHRARMSGDEMELRLAEDVFHCRKIQEVHSLPLATGHLSHALYENTRINFYRYLKHMDDPFKDFTDLDTSGHFRSLRSHRVYHFHLCVKIVSRPVVPSLTRTLAGLKREKKSHAPASHEQVLLYRIVLDKNGIVRVEEVSRFDQECLGSSSTVQTRELTSNVNS